MRREDTYELVSKHKRGQKQTGPQNIADPGLALDGSSLRYKFGNISINGSLGYLQHAGQDSRGYRTATPTKSLEQESNRKLGVCGAQG